MIIGHFVCSHCREISPKADWLEADNPFNSAEKINGCPKCGAVNSAEFVCDWPGCEEPATSGFPSFIGYRLVCHEHYRNDA